MPSTSPHADASSLRPGTPAPGRTFAWMAAIVLVVGSLLFLSGGRAHPAIHAVPGESPEAFFLKFAEKVHHTDRWHAMHLLILLGPLCWAVAAPALLDAIRPEARVQTSAARSALLLSGALWAVAFVIDGFGAPVYAAAIASAPSPAVAGGVLVSFQAAAVMMSRLGLVSWVAGGLGMIILGGSLLGPGERAARRMAVGLSGILIGSWPLAAALEGEYAAGPFTSPYWMPNALVVAVWYLALATLAISRKRAGSSSTTF